MFLVVWGHIIQATAYSSDGFYSDPIFKAIYTFHMPLFMAISGYLSYSSIQRYAYLPMLKRRFMQLIVPAFVGAAIFGIIVTAANVIQGSSILHALEQFPKLVFKTASSFWFLWAIFLFTVIHCTIKKFARDSVLIMTAVFIAYCLLPPFGKDYLFRFTLPFFSMGYLIARHGIPKIILKNTIFVSSSIVSIVLYLLWTKEDYIYVSKMTLNFDNLHHILFRMTCGIVISFSVLSGLFAIKKFRSMFLFSQIGKSSLLVYIAHSLALKLTPKITHSLDPLLISSIAAPIIAFLFCCICCVNQSQLVIIHKTGD